MDLQKLLRPKKLAIVGASEKENLGGFTTRMMREFAPHRMEDVYLVNPGRDMIFDQKCYKSLADIPTDIDMVVIATPKSSVEGLIREASAKGAQGAVVYASGYGETGKPEDKAAEASLKALCEELDMALMGPNCAGFINQVDSVPAMGFMTTVQKRSGSVGLVSQSGMICTLLLDSGKADFSYVISCGNSKIVEVVDYMDFLVDDPNTKVIASYIEGVNDSEKFIKTLQKAAKKKKPIVLIKVGKSEAGSRSAASHTGSLSGSDKAFDAIFEKYGVIRVDDLEDLASMSNLLSTLPMLPCGDRVVSLNGSGGENGVSCDVGSGAGMNFAEFSKETVDALSKVLPDYATINNPLDTTATICYDTDVFADAAEVIINDPNFDMALVGITIVNEMTDLCVKHMSEGLVKLSKESRLKKPVVVVPAIESGRMQEYVSMLKDAGIPVMPPCSYAYKHVRKMLDYAAWCKKSDEIILESAIPACLDGDRLALSEHDSKEMLKGYGIRVSREAIAKSEDEAVRMAEEIGYPIVLKVESNEILHKSDVGGVKLNLNDEAGIREAYNGILENCKKNCPDAKINGILVQEMLPYGMEIIIGINNDPLFGPMVLVGLGGVFVEVFKDVALRAAPFGKPEALEMIQSLKAYRMFDGYRGGKVYDVEALADTLVHVSDFAVANKDTLLEMDINPLFVYEKGKGVAAADGLIVKKK